MAIATMFQLDTGTWVDAERVESVDMIFPLSLSRTTSYQVIVTMFSGTQMTMSFDEREDAELERDRIAKSVNNVRSGLKP